MPEGYRRGAMPPTSTPTSPNCFDLMSDEEDHPVAVPQLATKPQNACSKDVPIRGTATGKQIAEHTGDDDDDDVRSTPVDGSLSSAEDQEKFDKENKSKVCYLILLTQI